MAGTSDIKSIIAVDFGSVNTRAVLIDLVDGAYRLVARAVTRTTADDPLRDVAVGLIRALTTLQEQTGRRLLEDGQRLLTPEKRDGSGVDALVATASVGQPLRVVVVGLMPDVSVASALHVLAGSYVTVVDTLSLADIRSDEQQLNAILARKPDMIFIVGGTDAGAEQPILDLVRIVRSAVQIAPHKPMVLYAGNRAAQDQVRTLLSGLCQLEVADNVRPSLEEESLGPAQKGLALLYDRFKMASGGGFDEVSKLSQIGVLPTAQSLTNIVRYLGEVTARDRRNPARGVLAVDVGSATTTVAASLQRQPYITIRTDIGIGHSAATLLDFTTPGNIRRWLTWDASDSEIISYLHNKVLRPATVPQTARELELEYAATREAIRVVVEEARTTWKTGPTMPVLRPIIGGGAVLANTPHPGLAALLLLDAIQPVGVTELWQDPVGLIPAMGALAYLKPEAVVQMIDEGDLIRIGSVACVEGQVRHIGRGGMRVVIRLADGQVVRHDIAAGTIWTYPLPPGQTAAVDITVTRGLSIGGRGRLRLQMTGGAAGLIFDARGRPLPLPRDAEVRAQLYPRWIAGTRGVIQRRADEVDESQVGRDEMDRIALQLEAETTVTGPAEELLEVADAPARPARRRFFGFLRRRSALAVEEALDEEAVEEDGVAETAPARDDRRAPASPLVKPFIDEEELRAELRGPRGRRR